jgi:hypothetical protein
LLARFVRPSHRLVFAKKIKKNYEVPVECSLLLLNTKYYVVLIITVNLMRTEPLPTDHHHHSQIQQMRIFTILLYNNIDVIRSDQEAVLLLKCDEMKRSQSTNNTSSLVLELQT